MITLTKIYDPLNRHSRDITQYRYTSGDTLLCSIKQAYGENIPEISVAINGVVVPKELWKTTKLVKGQHILMVPIIQGGGGGAKEVLRIVAMVVLAAVVVAYSGGMGLALGDALFSATGIGLSVTATTAIMSATMLIAGSMLINALLPPTMPTATIDSTIDQSNAYSWNPQTTQQQGICIPWAIGTCKLSGNIISVYRELNGTEEQLNMLISLGEGELGSIYDIKLNSQTLSNYEGITVENRTGALYQSPFASFDRSIVEYNVSRLVENTSPVIYTTIGDSFDSLAINIGFPNGLYKYNTSGNLGTYSVSYTIEISPHGLNDWVTVTGSSSSVEYIENRWSAGYYLTTNNSTTIWHELEAGSSIKTDHSEGDIYSINGFDATWMWFNKGYISSSTSSPSVASNNQTTAYNITHRASNLLDGAYDIRVTKNTADQTAAEYGDNLYLISVQEINYDTYEYPSEALIAIKAVANNQLSGAFSFECMTTGKKMMVYRDNDWHYEVSSNPAWVTWHILTMPIINQYEEVSYYRGYNADDTLLPNLAKFIEWAEYCDDLVPDGDGGTEKRLTFNGVIDAQQSTWDWALSVAKIGRGSIYWVGTTLTVAIDKPAEPVALISVGNIGLDSFEEVFLSMDNRANTVECDFINANEDYSRDKLTVMNTNAPVSWGTVSLPLQGVTKPSEAFRHAMYNLNSTLYIPRVVTLSLDVDAIGFTIGDVVQVQHDVPMWGEGGRILSFTSDTVTLDKKLYINSFNYSIMLRSLSGDIIERTVIPSFTETDTFQVSIPFPEDTLTNFDIYAIGQVDTVVKPMRVINITQEGDLKRKISFVDYVESIWDGDLLEPVIAPPQYSTPDPLAYNLQLTDGIYTSNDGSIKAYIDVKFSTSALCKEATVLFRIKDQSSLWQKITNITSNSVRIDDVLEQVTYEVKVESKNFLNKPDSAINMPYSTIYVYGKYTPPADVENFGLSIQGNQAILTWNISTDMDVSRGGHLVLRYSPDKNTTDWGSANCLMNSVSGGTTSVKVPLLEGVYMAKWVDSTGNFSINPATVISDASMIINANVIISQTCNPTWPGVKENVVVESGSIRIADGYSSGTYNVPRIYLGTAYNCRATSSIISSAYYIGDTIDQRTTLIDTWEEFKPASANSAGVELWVRYTRDSLPDSPSATWSEWSQHLVAADFYASAIDFQLRLQTQASDQNVNVSALTSVIDMPDLLQTGEDLVCSTSGLSVVYNIPFNVIPALAITGTEMGVGETYYLSNKTMTGFDITFKDSSGTSIEKTFDYIAKGY